MRRIVVPLVLVMSLVVAACGDDDANTDPASINSCAGLADASIVLLQETLDYIDSLSAEQLAELTSSETPPAAMADIEARGNALTARAETLGCTDQEMASLLVERADDLSSDTVFGQFIIEAIRAGEGSDFFGE